MQNGLVSVVIPVYNGAALLPATLQSVLSQSEPPCEVIVVDDGSTDDTPAIARSFGATVISVANGGPAAARNVGSRAARGEYIAYMDADDLWPPDKLALQVAALASYGRPAFSFTDYRAFDEQGFHKRTSELRPHAAFRRVAGKAKDRTQIVIADNGVSPVLYDSSYIAPSSVLIRRADFLASGGYDEELRYCEDYEFFLRLFSFLPAVVLMQPLLFYRKHAGQATSKARTNFAAGHFDVARRAAAWPQRYPLGDVRYLARTDYLRHFRLGILHARLGQFDEAVASLERSVVARRTVRASVALCVARVCHGGAGRFIFDTVRSIWKSRPSRR